MIDYHKSGHFFIHTKLLHTWCSRITLRCPSRLLEEQVCGNVCPPAPLAHWHCHHRHCHCHCHHHGLEYALPVWVWLYTSRVVIRSSISLSEIWISLCVASLALMCFVTEKCEITLQDVTVRINNTHHFVQAFSIVTLHVCISEFQIYCNGMKYHCFSIFMQL